VGGLFVLSKLLQSKLIKASFDNWGWVEEIYVAPEVREQYQNLDAFAQSQSTAAAQLFRVIAGGDSDTPPDVRDRALALIGHLSYPPTGTIWTVLDLCEFILGGQISNSAQVNGGSRAQFPLNGVSVSAGGGPLKFKVLGEIWVTGGDKEGYESNDRPERVFLFFKDERVKLWHVRDPLDTTALLSYWEDFSRI
jgi:hypothetical protein